MSGRNNTRELAGFPRPATASVRASSIRPSCARPRETPGHDTSRPAAAVDTRALCLEQAAVRPREPQVLVGEVGRLSPARGPFQEPELQEVGLAYVLDRVGFLVERR